MKQNKNELWKLDLIEAKFFKNTPRLQTTKKLLNARNNTKLMKKLPQTREEAHKQIHALKLDLFEKKFHGAVLRLHREVLKKLKADLRSWKKETHGSLQNLLQSEETLNHMVEAKLVKVFTAAVLNTKELKSNPPSYIPEDVIDKITNKKNPSNPSRFFIEHCQNDKLFNEYVSKLWNSKDAKKLIDEIDWSFRKVRGNLTVDEKNARSAATGKKSGNNESDEESESDESDSEESSDSDDSDSEGELESASEVGSDEEIDAEEAFDKFAAYDKLVAGSDDEGEFQEDPNVNYNEVTDEEPSEESEPELDEKAQKKKLKELKKQEKAEKKKEKAEKKEQEKKHKLPALATGYFSGGSDDEDEVDNDKIVKEATTTRKNRRGQRARQKIWEQKYGKKANHVQKENQRILNEREQKQREFEERQRKREMKARLAKEAEEANQSAPKLEKKPSTSFTQKMHPSWEAKKAAEEKRKAIKFTGKKITFD